MLPRYGFSTIQERSSLYLAAFLGCLLLPPHGGSCAVCQESIAEADKVALDFINRSSERVLVRVDEKHNRVVGLSVTGASEVCLSHVSKCEFLESLEIHESTLSSSAFSQLLGLKHIATLRVDDVPVDDSVLDVLAELPLLDDLVLRQTNITSIRRLACSKALRILTIIDSPLRDGMEAVEHLKTLEQLVVCRTLVDDAAVAPLAKSTSLRTLVLSENALTDNVADALSRMTELKYLDLSDTGVTDTGYLRIKKGMPKAIVLYEAQ